MTMRRVLIGTLVLAVTCSFAQAVVLDSSGSPVPTDPNLRLWLDASDLSTLWQDTAGTISAAAGLGVARWDDKSLSGIIVQQGNVADQPTYTASVGTLSGRPALYFEGDPNDDVLTSTTNNSTGITGNDDRTMITVWSEAVNTGLNYQHSIHMGNASGNQAYGHSVMRGGNGQIGNHYWGSGHDTGVAGATNPFVAVSVWDGNGGAWTTNGTDSWWVNGTLTGAANRIPLNTATNQLHVGSRLNPIVEGMRGQLAEIIVYEGGLTQIERDRIGGYIQSKYGISVANALSGSGVTLQGPHIGGLHSHADFADLSDWVLNGSAVQNGNRLQLTDTVNNQAGSAWLDGRVMLDYDGSFSAEFAIAISPGGGNAADGLALVLHNDPDGTGALGGAGGAVGLNGIEDALGIVVDDYQASDIHIRRGLSGITLASANVGGWNAIVDGAPRYLWVSYDGTAQSMAVYFSDSAVRPDAPLLVSSLDLLSLTGGRRDLYVGFTGGTGGLNARHEILSFDFVGVPEPATMALLGAGLALMARRRRRG